jgi:cell wall-associated NlpC family hydrolase
MGEALVRFDMGAYPEPANPAPYEVLRTGDIVLAHQRTSHQDKLYHPSYTHAALYMGAGPDGAPLLFEAVSEDNATSLGPVAAVPIEKSLAWRDADRVDVFRVNGGLAREDRNRIVAWSSAQAARGLPFASTADFGDIYRMWLMWDSKHDKPRDKGEFQRLIAGLRERLLASDAYDCATLVWHAYRDNTAAHIDLANPNRIAWGGATEGESQHLAAALQQFLILPDSFALSGKLSLVTGN